MTSASLLASRIRLPALAAARAGRRPAAPTIAATTVSAPDHAAASTMPASPPRTRVGSPAPARARSRRRAASGSDSAATSGRWRRQSCASFSHWPLAVSAATREPVRMTGDHVERRVADRAGRAEQADPASRHRRYASASKPPPASPPAGRRCGPGRHRAPAAGVRCPSRRLAASAATRRDRPRPTAPPSASASADPDDDGDRRDRPRRNRSRRQAGRARARRSQPLRGRHRRLPRSCPGSLPGRACAGRTRDPRSTLAVSAIQTMAIAASTSHGERACSWTTATQAPIRTTQPAIASRATTPGASGSRARARRPRARRALPGRTRRARCRPASRAAKPASGDTQQIDAEQQRAADEHPPGVPPVAGQLGPLGRGEDDHGQRHGAPAPRRQQEQRRQHAAGRARPRSGCASRASRESAGRGQGRRRRASRAVHPTRRGPPAPVRWSGRTVARAAGTIRSRR